MRTLMKVTFPVGPGNRGIVDGSLAETVDKFVEQMKPEAVYFTAQNGKRMGMFVFDLQDTSQIPVVAESFFQNLDAEIELAPVMNLDDLRAGLAKALKRNGKEKGKGAPAQAR